MANENYKQLLRASSLVWRLVFLKEEYEAGFVLFKEGKTVPYQEALEHALDKLQKALIASGSDVDLPVELEYYLKRQIERVSLN